MPPTQHVTGLMIRSSEIVKIVPLIVHENLQDCTQIGILSLFFTNNIFTVVFYLLGFVNKFLHFYVLPMFVFKNRQYDLS